MRRFEARLFRLVAGGGAWITRAALALWFFWNGSIGFWGPHSVVQTGPTDWRAQAISIMSVGHITFSQAPRLIGAGDLLLGALVLLVPASFAAALWSAVVFVLATLPLFMLRDDLWSPIFFCPSAAGWGLLAFSLSPLMTLLFCCGARWQTLQARDSVTALLAETPQQVQERVRRWKRFGGWFGPLALAIAIVWPFAYPRYLHWFHVRQERATLGEKLAGRLLRKSMPPSKILHGKKMSTWVYLPPGYDKDVSKRYPVVYVMHGMPGEVRDCFVKGRIQDAAEALIKSRAIQPLIIVGWDGQGPAGPGDVSNFLDRPDYKMESFMVQELVPYIDRTYRTLKDAGHRSLDGISAGGYAAPNLLFKHPAVWKVAASHNGFFSPEDDVKNMTNILGPRGPAWDANDPMKTLRKFGPADRLHIYVDIGAGDDLVPEFHVFVNRLKARHIDCEAHVFPGRHTWTFWSTHFYDSLRFESRAFAAARPASAASGLSVQTEVAPTFPETQ